MKLSIAIPTLEKLYRERNLEKVIMLISECGYNAIEPLFDVETNLDSDYIKAILSKYNISISGLRTGGIYLNTGISLLDPDYVRRREALEKLLNSIIFARSFNTNILIGLVQGNMNPKVPREISLKWQRESLRECAEVAAKNNILLMIEPINRGELNHTNTIEEVKTLIQDIGKENIRILIDTYHMNLEEKDIEGAIFNAKAYIGHVHIADTERKMPGRGNIDFRRIIRYLQLINYDGYITVESNMNLEDQEELVHVNYFLRRCWVEVSR